VGDAGEGNSEELNREQLELDKRKIAPEESFAKDRARTSDAVVMSSSENGWRGALLVRPRNVGPGGSRDTPCRTRHPFLPTRGAALPRPADGVTIK
jgi:hypothetical protein